jgi:hypothetical protein
MKREREREREKEARKVKEKKKAEFMAEKKIFRFWESPVGKSQSLSRFVSY